MSLPSPISIGDAIALSSIAWNIAKAFLPGTADAKDDCRELHGLLCALRNALRLVGETFCLNNRSQQPGGIADVPDHSNNTASIISETLSHCNGILGNLKILIETYSILEQDPDSAAGSTSATGRKMKRSWMKLLWTAEGDNISGLKQSLTVHIQTLNLAIATTNRSVLLHRHWIDGCVLALICCRSERLGEIFNWLKTNLRSQENCQDCSAGSLIDEVADLRLINESLTFILFGERQLSGSREEYLICPGASLAHIDSFSAKRSSATQGGVFECLCSRNAHECAAYSRRYRSAYPHCQS